MRAAVDKVDLVCSEVRKWLLAHTSRPLFVLLSGIQGSGKSRLAVCLSKRLPGCVAMSLDDFYMNPGDLKGNELPLLRQRGLPGTHDVQEGVQVFQLLAEQKPCEVPVYDKIADRRASPRRVSPPYSVVILEGWCLGFVPLPGIGNHPVFTALQQYEDRWFRPVNPAFIHLSAPTEWAPQWRWEQERDQGQPMTRTQLEEFMGRFNWLYDRCRVSKDIYRPYFSLELDSNRGVRCVESLKAF